MKFCALCGELQTWIAAENTRRGKTGEPLIPRDVLGLRSAENYHDAKDAPRIATIYNGLRGHGHWVPFRKGDPQGNRWLDNEPLFIDWTSANVDWLLTSPRARWQGHDFFFRVGVSWTRGANHVPIKAKFVEASVPDINAMKLSPLGSAPISAKALLAIFNSDLFSFFLKRFIAHTWMAQINDLRIMPLVIPTSAQAKRLENLAGLAMRAKRLEFAAEPPDNALVADCRELAQQLEQAPTYLHAGAQAVTYQKPNDCLQVIERVVYWEAEKLYGVEGLGPFDEF